MCQKFRLSYQKLHTSYELRMLPDLEMRIEAILPTTDDFVPCIIYKI